MGQHRQRISLPRTALSVATTAALMTALDLLWLGVIARDFYVRSLQNLMRTETNWPAAAMFYLFYITAITMLAVIPSASTTDAAKRGAMLGGVAYGTYELTNWAVLANWPALLVPVDIAWGILLTAAASAAGRAVRGNRA